MNDGMKYGAGLTIEQRLARLEQQAILKSIGTTEGDLIGFDDNGLPIRIPAAGANGSVITSDITQPGAAKWVPGWSVVSERTGRGNPGGTFGVRLMPDGVLSPSGTAGSTRAHVYIDPSWWGGSIDLMVRGWVQTETDPTDSSVNVNVSRLTTVGATGTIGGATSTGLPGATIAGVNAASSVYTNEGSASGITDAGYYCVIFQHTVAPGQTLSYGYTLLVRPL